MTESRTSYITPLASEFVWIERLISVVKPAISDGYNVVIIAIARKMARLVEYFKDKSMELNELITDNPRVSIITEHAIPTALSGSKPDNTKVIILDDFVVYGDTVEMVSENVFYLTGIKPMVIAIAASKEVKFFSMWNEIAFPKINSKCKSDIEAFIDWSKVPAFTARNSYHILSLCKPIDIEHTIFEIKLSDKQYTYLKENLEEMLRLIFPSAVVYSIRHRLPDTGEETLNVSVCHTSRIGRIKNNDFNKFRFFISKDSLSVVSYAPNIWDSYDLESNKDLFIYSDLNDCWKYYKDLLNSICYQDISIEDHMLESILSDHFKDRLELCRVVWANYLKSFENALIFKYELEDLASKIELIDTPGLEDLHQRSDDSLTIHRENINWLIGAEAVNDVFPFLQSAKKSESANTKIIGLGVSEGDAEPLVPSDKKQYQTDKLSYVLMCPGVDTAMSMIFYKLWRDYGLAKKEVSEERIKLGETYQSLERIFRIVYKSDKPLKENINRWIDQRIDMGVVVPKYECSYTLQGKKIWRRYFRPGEREDIMVDVARLALIVTDIYAGKEDVSFSDFSELLLRELFDISHENGAQASVECFSEGLFQKIRKPKNNPDDRNLAYTVWTYMIILKAFELPRLDNWSIVKVDQNNFNVSLKGSPIFSLK